MLTERFVSAACLFVLVTAITVLNDQVRQSMAGILRAELLTQFPLVGGRTLGLARLVTGTIGSYTGDHLSMVLFGVGGLVFLGLMLRT